VTYKNHLKLGFRTVEHRNKKVATSLNAKSFSEAIENIEQLSYRTGVIPPGFEHRADRIADLFYDNPNLDWLVCWSNNVSDPFQQLNVGDRIRILDL
jgi:hypothetical protein